MIPIFDIEDLTIEKVDELIERGVVFDIASKASILSKSNCNYENDKIRCSRSERESDL